MKKFTGPALAVLIICFLATINISIAQKLTPSMEAWKGLLDKPELANYFSDVFNNLGIEVEETGEKFTVHHKGDHFTLTHGIDENKVNYVARIKLQNVKNMVQHGTDANISTEESFKILSVLFKLQVSEPALKNAFCNRRVKIKYFKV